LEKVVFLCQTTTDISEEFDVSISCVGSSTLISEGADSPETSVLVYHTCHIPHDSSALLTINKPTEGYSQLSAHFFCPKEKTVPHSAKPQQIPGI
jgi:hypothetical protein